MRSQSPITTRMLCSMSTTVTPRARIAPTSPASSSISPAVEPRRRLVEHEHGGVAHEGARDLEALLLAERQRPGQRAEIDGQAHEAERLLHAG
jgi:hypothetical protein